MDAVRILMTNRRAKSTVLRIWMAFVQITSAVVAFSAFALIIFAFGVRIANVGQQGAVFRLDWGAGSGRISSVSLATFATSVDAMRVKRANASIQRAIVRIRIAFALPIPFVAQFAFAAIFLAFRVFVANLGPNRAIVLVGRFARFSVAAESLPTLANASNAFRVRVAKIWGNLAIA